MVTKVTYVGDTFTRKPPKYERFIRPSGLRFRKAHVSDAFAFVSLTLKRSRILNLKLHFVWIF